MDFSKPFDSVEVHVLDRRESKRAKDLLSTLCKTKNRRPHEPFTFKLCPRWPNDGNRSFRSVTASIRPAVPSQDVAEAALFLTHILGEPYRMNLELRDLGVGTALSITPSTNPQQIAQRIDHARIYQGWMSTNPNRQSSIKPGL